MIEIVLGFAGEIASGKGTAGKYIADKYGAGFFRFSDMLRDVLDRLYLEHNRDNIASLSEVLRKTFGQDLLAKVMKKDIGHKEGKLVVIDGIRRLDDIIYLKELPQFKLVYIEADLKTRYKRIIQRGENIDDKQKTFKDFKRDQQLETELQIKNLKNHADFVIDNGGSEEQLREKIDKIIKNIIKQ